MGLTSSQRSVLHTLILAETYTQAEIARRVECSDSTVHRHARLLDVDLPRKKAVIDRAKVRYLRLKNDGQCVTCGQRDAEKNKVQCTECRGRRNG